MHNPHLHPQGLEEEESDCCPGSPGVFPVPLSHPFLPQQPVSRSLWPGYSTNIPRCIQGPWRRNPHLHHLEEESHSGSAGRTTAVRPLPPPLATGASEATRGKDSTFTHWKKRVLGGTDTTCNNCRKKSLITPIPY